MDTDDTVTANTKEILMSVSKMVITEEDESKLYSVAAIVPFTSNSNNGRMEIGDEGLKNTRDVSVFNSSGGVDIKMNNLDNGDTNVKLEIENHNEDINNLLDIKTKSNDNTNNNGVLLDMKIEIIDNENESMEEEQSQDNGLGYDNDNEFSPTASMANALDGNGNHIEVLEIVGMLNNSGTGDESAVKSPQLMPSPSSIFNFSDNPVPVEDDIADKTEYPQPVSAPPVICANGLSDCQEVSLGTHLCRRCHQEFYCCEEHKQNNLIRHEKECKTASKFEAIAGDEEFRTWCKYSAPYLYDICLNFVLVWPSLTAQWFPDFLELDNNIIRHKILLGTQTEGDMNHLLICGIDIPERQDGRLTSNGVMSVLKRINHEGEINRARYMPQNTTIIATKSPSSDVFVFDINEFPDIAENDIFRPSLRLRGHNKEGFGVAWSPHEPGKIVSGSSDGVVCLWDVNTTPIVDDGAERVIKAFTTLVGHTDVVEDVAWHNDNEHICASVGDDNRLVIWDLRTNSLAHSKEDAHSQDINAVSFSPFSEFALATGSSDKTVGIWDLRNANTKLHTLDYHKSEVMQILWSPHESTVLSSTGKDKRVFVWNIAHNVSIPGEEGEEASGVSGMDDDELLDGPEELSFVHGGHVTPINDMSWNIHEMGMMASVSEDNILQIWKISEDVMQPECLDEDDQDLQSDEEENALFE